MKQVTIRILDKDLQNSLARVAQEQKISLESAALYLLREGAGLGGKPNHSGSVGSSPDRFVGSWEVVGEPDLSGADGRG